MQFVICGALCLSACSSDSSVKTNPSTTALSASSTCNPPPPQNGVHCWEANLQDLDGDGSLSLEETTAADINGDGSLDVYDCLGQVGERGPQGLKGDTGPAGQNGTNGRDGTNGTNGVNCFDGMTMDQNGDGVINRLDCRGPAGNNGSNGANGQNGRDGINCYDGLNVNTDDRNGDGQLTVADCQGADANPQFGTLEVIKCKVGGDIPGGVDSTGLMNEHFQNSNGSALSATAQCSPGKMLIMSMVTSVKLSNNIIQGNTNDPKIDYGVASGRFNINDPYPTRIECFFTNRFPNNQNPPSDGTIAVTGMGLCAPIPTP